MSSVAKCSQFTCGSMFTAVHEYFEINLFIMFFSTAGARSYTCMCIFLNASHVDSFF